MIAKRVQLRILLACALALLALGCSSTKKKVAAPTGVASSLDAKGVGGERCDATKPAREQSTYDTSGDGVPDVRKVFMSLGEGAEARLVMICRETDVNGDGRKDVIRYYDDDGRSVREESDRDFDGKMDLVYRFQDGKVVVQEIDENRDGRVDTKIFLDNGKPSRAERDLAGRSNNQQWRADRWEYYEEGRMVRMGTDLDGDGRVDRWDRDLQWKSAKDGDGQMAVPEPDAESQPQTDTAAPPEAKPST